MKIFVNAPYKLLKENLDVILKKKINPEIGFDSEALDALNFKELGNIVDKLKKAGLSSTIHGPFMDLAPGGKDRKVKKITLERYLKTIDAALIVNPENIVFHPGYDKWRYDGNIEGWLKSSLETWQAVVEKAEKRRLTVSIENIFEETPETIIKLLKRINSPNFKHCFDTGHFNIFARVDLQKWFKILGENIFEVHIHDNNKLSDSHLPPGRGDFDFESFFKLLKKSSKKPIITIEPHKVTHLSETLKVLKKSYSNLIDDL